MSSSILEIKDITFKYPDGTKALNNLSMSIPKGQKVAILGPNGAGKSTLFLHLNGILQPEEGEIFFEEKRIAYKKKELECLRKNVGIVFQDPDMQLFSASVLQEISFGPLNLGLSETEVRKRVKEVMEVTEVSNFQDKPTHLLSYGQKKRVSIASILAMNPKVIIFDEPTVWLDPKHSQEVINFFDQLQKHGKTVIISTHNVDLAYSWADYIYIINDGMIIKQGDPKEIFQDQATLKEANLRLPWVVEVYNQMKSKGLLTTEEIIPKNKEELFKIINN